MEVRQGYSYHIKNEFFDLVQDKYLTPLQIPFAK